MNKLEEPWNKPPLNEWSICGMNHYHIEGKRMLFVSMVKDSECITTEGEDNVSIWTNLIIQAEKIKAKSVPEVPWVGAFVEGVGVGYYHFTKNSLVKHFVKIVDSPLHPQFMPNDGVNPWPDDMKVQTTTKSGTISKDVSSKYTWDKQLGGATIIGSRPACGWEEYLKERE